jgi:hypothetical protein
VHDLMSGSRERSEFARTWPASPRGSGKRRHGT